MKIAFTGSIFFNQKIGGISRYFTMLAKNLNSKKIKTKIIAPLNKNIYLKDIYFKEKISIFFPRMPDYSLISNLNNFLSNIFIKKFNPNIVHETYYSENIKSIKNIKKIITIYDLIHEKFSSDYTYNKIEKKKKILHEIDHFICISKQTKKDFISFYKIPDNKVSVVYLGSEHLSNLNLISGGPTFKKKYILYIGSRKKYKNFEILLKALKKIKSKDILLLCFGGESISEKEKYYAAESGIEIRRIVGNDAILAHIIKNAACLVSTSIYEGFGLPNVEAMSLNCPLVCSDISIFNEVCSTAALYFNPESSNDLACRIDSVISEESVRNDLIKKGFEQSKKYTWKKCAEQTLEIYKKLLINK